MEPTKRLCTVDDCERPYQSRGWCSAHYMRWRNHGDVFPEVPIASVNTGKTVEARFWEKVDRSGGPDACWPRTGWHDRIGYGRFRIGDQQLLAHRVAWMLDTGELIPEGMCVLHHCDNPPCCNRRHLFLGTQADNMADCVKKGRMQHHQALKTHCPQRHLYDDANTYITSTGERLCRACNRNRARKRLAA